jgi:hypothetical protein
MDKLAQRLRADADRIDVEVSAELEQRIEASLRAVEPAKARPRPVVRPPWFWLASTLTGVAAAIAVIAIVNWQAADETLAPPPVPVATVTPVIDLNAEAAMLTSPLQQELENLQSDLKKAEEKVRRDIGL